MDKTQMFDSLVENALDFLRRAIEEIDDHPKYSVIHFHAAVELIIKARLMHEHWALIVAKNSEPDWDKFVVGDFQSVTMDEAANKLSKIARSGLTNSELEAFRGVAKHRNKMVHFFHEAGNNDDALKQKIVKQQLKAWNYLHQLIMDRWKEVFENWAGSISDIDIDLRELHEYLQVIFDGLQERIEKEKQKGNFFELCPSCGFESQLHMPYSESLYEAECLVCSLIDLCIQINCFTCNGAVTFFNSGHGECLTCGTKFKPADLADALIDHGSAHLAAQEGDLDFAEANCSVCDGYHSVIRIKDSDEWLCVDCFNLDTSIETCGWCNEKNTGDMTDSYVMGCNFCEGMKGWQRDD